MPLYKFAHEFAMPTPVHAQTKGAHDAVAVMRAAGEARLVARVLAVGMVTDHGRPPVEPYVRAVMAEAPYTRIKITKKGKVKPLFEDVVLYETGEYEALDPVTPAARRLLADAEARGWKTNLVVLTDRCAVEAVRGTEAFRAVWVRGSATRTAAGHAGARWFDRDYRYEYIDDPRPEPQLNKLARISIAKRRPVGVSKHHLKVVASPRGIPISITELSKRVKES